MKKELLKYAAFFLMAVSAVVFTACEESGDDDEESVSIVGVWTVQSVSMDASIAGKSIEDYFTELGFPTELIQEFVNELNNELQKMEDMSGTLELKEDGTYVSEFSNDDPEDDDTGTWELTTDGKTLTIDKGTDDEMIFEVITLTKTTLTVKASQQESMEELSDPMDISMTINFTR